MRVFLAINPAAASLSSISIAKIDTDFSKTYFFLK